MISARLLRCSFFLGAVFTASVLIQGCGVSKNYFGAASELASSGGGNGSGGGGGTVTTTGGTGHTSPCTPQQATNLRISFVVDASGSTVQDDPNAQVRGTASVNFINANASDANLTYSYGYFGQTFQPSWDYSLSQTAGTNDFVASPVQAFGASTLATGAVNEFVSLFNANKIPGSGTNYQTAFTALQNVIAGDAAKNPGFSYVVIFMSDGQPNAGGTSETDINGYVTSLMAAVGAGRMTVSSVYFNDAKNADATEDTIMFDIANTGGGQYVNTLTAGSSLNLNTMIQNLIVVPGTACPS